MEPGTATARSKYLFAGDDEVIIGQEEMIIPDDNVMIIDKDEAERNVETTEVETPVQSPPILQKRRTETVKKNVKVAKIIDL